MRLHCEPIELVDYARGRLSKRAAARVREHCSGCEDCGDQLAAVILLRRGAAVESPVRDRRPMIAAAAAAAVAVVGLGWFAVGGFEPGSQTLEEATLAAARPAGGDPPVITATQYEPEEVVELTRLVAPLRPLIRPAAASATANDKQAEALANGSRYAEEGDIASMASVLQIFDQTDHFWGTLLLGAAQVVSGDFGAGTESNLRVAAEPWLAGTIAIDRYDATIAVLYLSRLEHARGHDESARRILVALIASGNNDGVVEAAVRDLQRLR